MPLTVALHCSMVKKPQFVLPALGAYSAHHSSIIAGQNVSACWRLRQHNRHHHENRYNFGFEAHRHTKQMQAFRARPSQASRFAT